MKASGRSRTCIQIADYGELCYLDQQCEFRLGLYAECRNSQCSCKNDSHYVVNENACYKSSSEQSHARDFTTFFTTFFPSRIEIGDYCRLTSNCAVEQTKCVKGECRCPLGFHPNWERNRCLKSAKLNESCAYNEECLAENSICYRTCKCRTGHVLSVDGERCLPLATSLYQRCHEESQCAQLPYSTCGLNGTCICLPDHHDINSVRIADDSFTDEAFLNVELRLNFFQRCHVSVRLHQTCEDDLNCVIAHSSCVNRRCTCDEDFHEFRGKFCSKAARVQISFLVALVVAFGLARL
jgi:EB module